MKKSLLVILLALGMQPLLAQQKDIPVSQLPLEVKQVLDQY